ncbi:MAG: hypothetical protein JXB48_04770 [Candidatus Latescibacteria bacterium]|nr:hypothetical protein [Candidatus Latescibacterota bacterium]
MNRRDMIKTLPLLSTVFYSLPRNAASEITASQPLCLEYLNRVTGIIEKIRNTELDNMLEASYNIARTYKSGNTCFCQWETGHSFDGDMFPDRPGDTDIFTMGYTMGTPAVEPKNGDLLLVNVLRKPLDDPRQKGIFVIGGPTPWCGDTANTELLTEANRQLQIKKYSDIWIETYITTRGALMWLPGETTPLGPTSGALGIVTYWAMIADAVRLLVKDNIFVKVKGDEPALPDTAPYINLNQPTAESYINESLRQISQIGAEYGTIKRIAQNAADCILSGGKLYVYSRHHEALSQEAQGKRGGLALINTTFADDTKFAGTGKDFMIMGIYLPDDEVDLNMLDTCRKSGMKIAAIGPATRDDKLPEGRTVPHEADYHLGLMCDTYGIFAVQGVDKKICPSSGLLVNLMFWATMIELAEEILRRTGNTPAVLSTGALVGGGEQRRRSTEKVKMRGY